MCKKNKRCENEVSKKDEEFDPENKNKSPPPNHGGCGNAQPAVRQQALQLQQHFQHDNEEGGGKTIEKKQLPPKMVHDIFRRISDADLEDGG